MDGLRFDDVIVGGGSAGCVLANRLSANGRRRVLLIEAGTDTPPGAVPSEILDSYPMPLFFGERYIWPGLKVVAAKGRTASVYEQGRVMGGGSSINVQAANRGLPRDYDEWRELGASGWGWNDVLPYFRRLEADLDFDGPLHGQDGPIPIRRIRRQDWPAFANAVGEKFAAHGFAFREDQNAEFEDGIFPLRFPTAMIAGFRRPRVISTPRQGGVWHASGTCRMGDPSDPLAVVDPKGKVIAAENLFVADASIMPRLPTANTNLPTIMIAEKIADSLLAS